jgi:hypothetical protein
MNNDRRKMITAATTAITDAIVDLETATDEEREYYDNMPEGIQLSEKGERADEVVCELENIVSELQDFEERIMELI